jgi:hypothetical protein
MTTSSAITTLASGVQRKANPKTNRFSGCRFAALFNVLYDTSWANAVKLQLAEKRGVVKGSYAQALGSA